MMGEQANGVRQILLPVIAFAVLASAPLLFSSPYLLGMIITALAAAAAAQAWNLSGGLAGQLSLGHSAFYGIGAYTSTLLYLKTGLSPIVGMWIGAVICAASAILLGWITMRLKGSFFVMATLAFGAVVHISAINLRELTGGTTGLSIPLTPSVTNLVFANKLVFAYLALGLVIVFYVITRVLLASKIGYALIAFRENDDAARALGIRTLPLRVGIFAFSAALMSICGTFHAQYFLYIDPDSVLSLGFSLQIALIAIVGGLGTASGPILGALIITGLSLAIQLLIGTQISGLIQLVDATVVIIVLLLAPRGLGPVVGSYLQRRFGWRS